VSLISRLLAAAAAPELSLRRQFASHPKQHKSGSLTHRTKGPTEEERKNESLEPLFVHIGSIDFQFLAVRPGNRAGFVEIVQYHCLYTASRVSRPQTRHGKWTRKQHGNSVLMVLLEMFGSQSQIAMSMSGHESSV
jgi:hypothetical protein